MAQRVHIVLEDDIDGGDADETVLFGLDGVNYEIDLSDKNAAKLRDSLSKYIGVGPTHHPPSRRGSASKRRRPHDRTVREWARSNGYEVSDRGRISADIRAAYDAAN